MLAPSPIVKKEAKDALSKHFLNAVVSTSVFIFSFFAITLITSLVQIFAGNVGYIVSMALFILLLLGPLFLGVLNFLRRFLWEQTDDLLLVFKYFSDFSEYKRAVRFVFSLGMRFVLIAAALYMPCVVVRVLANEQLYLALNISFPIWTSNLWALNSFLGIIATMAFVFVTLKYYLSAFIFVSNDNVDIAEAINMSTIISKRTGADFFGLVLSFAGWILLSLFILPLIITVPYFVMSYCTHCRFAISAYNKDVEVFNSEDTPSFRIDEI